jgi:ribose-phosphate pyrophosphokinase
MQVEDSATHLAGLWGLEVVDHPAESSGAESESGRWIHSRPEKRLMVFAGRSHPELAGAIGEKLGVGLGEIRLETFANGETYCRFEQSIRGADVFVVQTGCRPIDKHLMELLMMIQAAKLGSAKRVTAVMPLMPYARQDRKAKPREPISSRLVADLLQVAGADRVLTMDLHAGQIQGFFSVPVDHMTALPLFAAYFRDRLAGRQEEIVSVAPDEGGARLAVRFAEMVGADVDVALMHKSRPTHDTVRITEITGTVCDRIAIVGDDVIMTGGTLLANVEKLLEQGAKEVWLYATHGLFSGNALERFGAANIAGIVTTDTAPIDRLHRPDNLIVLPVSGLLAQTILNVFTDHSVSGIFGEDNQLF